MHFENKLSGFVVLNKDHKHCCWCFYEEFVWEGRINQNVKNKLCGMNRAKIFLFVWAKQTHLSVSIFEIKLKCLISSNTLGLWEIFE